VTRGAGLVEVVVATALGLLVLSVLTLVIGVGGRVLAACGARGEAEDTAQLAIEAFTFDARRAGFDPTAAGIDALAEARPDRIAFLADLDASGSVDTSSEESMAHVCVAGQLSRIIGRQSLPLADHVTRCAFHYFDRDGVEIVAPPAGLDAAGRRTVRAVALDLALRPARLRGESARTILVALRGLS
jgi:hypothetical protein